RVAQQEAAVGAELPLDRRRLLGDRGHGVKRRLPRDAHVDELLREAAERREQAREPALARARDRQQLQRGEQAVAGQLAVAREQQVTRLLAAEREAVLL